MKQKLLILLCALMATVSASAYDFSYEYNGTTFYLNQTSSNTCEIESVSYNSKDIIVIPSEVTFNGATLTVTSFGERSFSYLGSLTSVEIPNTVISIGKEAFRGCYSLTSVEIPNSVTSIGESAFCSCSGLQSFYGKFASEDNACLIVDGVLNSFAPYFRISYTIPNSVTSIGGYAFFNCTILESVKIPNTVTSIGENAFLHCTGLTSVEIPISVTSIGESAFCHCSKLKSFYGKFASEDNACLIVDGVLNSFAPYCRISYTIPNSVTSIGAYAFSYSNVSSIKIPNAVTSIGESAFEECSSLKSVTMPNSLTSIGNSAFYNCYNLSSVEIPNSVTSIGESAFERCTHLASVVIPTSVTSIGKRAFITCERLISLTLFNCNPDDISLGTDVFSGVPTSTCILYVPKHSKTLYENVDQWKAFTNIVEFFDGVSLTDGEGYAATEDLSDVDVEYTRTFNNTEWQPLYVPFNMSYEEWSEYADVAEVYNVRAYDTDNDEKIDDITIEFNKLTSGEIVPNIPYVIRAKSTGTVTFECSGKTMLAAPEEEGTIECSSTKMTYSFHGVYQSKTDLYSSGVYHLSDGAFRRAKSDAAVLSPNRFYLKITPKTGGYNPSSLPNKIRMIVDGEEVTTGIEDIEADTPSDGIYYDLTGRQVKNPTRGIYIQNGNKVVIK